MTYSEAIAAIAAATGVNEHRVRNYARRLQIVGELPLANSRWHAPHLSARQIALIFLALLTGAPLHLAVPATVSLAYNVTNDGKISLGDAVAALVAGAGRDEAGREHAGSVTIEVGQHGFATIRTQHGDGTNTGIQFMPGGGWSFNEAKMPGIVTTRTLPGAAIVKVGEAMRNV